MIVALSSYMISSSVEHGDYITHGYPKLSTYFWALGLQDKENRGRGFIERLEIGLAFADNDVRPLEF